ncbi:salt tolerance down-regulator-domain-containing protein [Biscogniauxia marginata]|nr:salt tolerance down-regulator-domain-containing protein [Biscogniauxia marginata]
MPANNRHSAQQPAASPAPKATAKYTNKDGTKYISVPKSSASTPPAQPSPTTTSSSRGGAPMSAPNAAEGISVPAVNRKKQRRRAKAAAKAAEKAAAEKSEATANGLPSPASTSSVPPPPLPKTERKNAHISRNVPSAEHYPPHSLNHIGEDWGEETESDDGHADSFSQDGDYLPPNGSASKSKKPKKKKKSKVMVAEQAQVQPSGISKEKIWNTSGPEERERIKQFWLGLGEDERKSLVKVEKDAVLKKMKEQQKHTCSCTVCGRKRTAIEEELEGLYDAYYQELESFANQPHNHPNGPPMFGPKRFGPMSGLHPPEHPPRAMPSRYSNHHPSRAHIVGNDDDEEEEAEEYSDEDDLEDEEDEDEPEEIPRDSYPKDFFNFGQSLTVKGGILTVADDLLKNDGKKFIEMMEQLAERRMAREEDARDHYSTGYGHTVNGGSLSNPHNHIPPEDDDYDDEDDEEEDYDSQDEDYEEEDDTMTEEQRMEEGRRMFQIFAARMFEQRVLTAYREKVAKERQEKLLEELAQEESQESQRKAKKAKDAQKRKDKAAQKKQALLEEKAKREAEKAAEEEARLAEETRRHEEARLKAEEKRKKRDAQKKAEEEERQRKEVEKQRRANELKEKQAEQERKARDAKERDRKLKEEQRRQEQQARERKEQETRERREKHEKDRRDKEQRAAQAKAERDAKEKQKQEEKASQKAAVLTAPIPTQPAKKQHPVSVPAIPHHPISLSSPQISVATPALPKAPTPMKPRSVSQEVTRSVSQASHSASGPSQTASPHALTPLHSSPGPIGPPSKTPSAGPPVQPTSPLHPGAKSPPGLPHGPFEMGMPPLGMQFPPGMPPMTPGFGRIHDPIFPPMGGNFRHGGMPMPPPGLGGHMGGRPFPIQHAPPGFPHPVDQPIPGVHQAFSPPESAPGQPSSHSRQGSASLDPGPLDPKGPGIPSQPISRPTPIGRPASIVHGQRNHDLSVDIDDVSNHLGSSALLDDSDEPFMGSLGSSRGATVPPGARPVFPGAPFMNPVFGSPLASGWGAPSVFSAAPPPGFASPAWPSNPAFGAPPPATRAVQPRPITVRQMLVRSCKDLENHAADAAGYIELPAIMAHVDSINLPPSEPVSKEELLEMCETEGNPQNGGGSFDIRRDGNGKVAIRYEADDGVGPLQFSRKVGPPGEIGSPVAGLSSLLNPRS